MDSIGTNIIYMHKFTIIYKEGDKIGNCFYVRDTRKVDRMRVALFKCECGNEFETFIKNVKSGNTNSCGCYKKKVAGKHSFKHGHSGLNVTSEYMIWANMNQRCNNKNNTHFKDYGGRGIFVCEKWISSFSDFFKEMGSRPSKKHTLDRIDNNKGYCIENCKWSTRKEQIENRRTSLKINFNGEIKSLKDWSDHYSISYKLLHKRLFSCKWPIEKALSSNMYDTKGKSKQLI